MKDNRPEVSRDSSGRMKQVATSDRIEGPLGIWPWPILNMIASRSNSKVEITEIRRDKRGNIKSIEEFRL